MKNNIYITIIVLFTYVLQVSAQDNFNPEKFAKTYFDAWNKTQAPKASEADLENFLALLTDDVALIHPPYDMTDTREPNGKGVIRTGMNRWRGANTSYKATLIEINHGHNVIIIKYQAVMSFLDKKTGKERTIERNNIEVLELDQGKVAIIRKYGKY